MECLRWPIRILLGGLEQQHCKTEIANSSNSRIRVYCTNESANFARLANSTIFSKLVILVIIVFGVLVDSYWFDLRLGVPVGVTES